MLTPDPFSAEAPARERILQTAQRLFYQHSIRATGVDTIIAQARVTKVTFYRHFPGKNDLVLAFLDRRHQRWMAGFTRALAAYPCLSQALPVALGSWFQEEDYRGCAFINACAELAGTFPEADARIREHKQAMAATIAAKLSETKRPLLGQIVMLVEGAIVRTQQGERSEEVVNDLSNALRAIIKSGA